MQPESPSKAKRFVLSEVLERMGHYLPSQLPLKNFVHHNVLHAFQGLSFHEAILSASRKFGAKGYLSLDEYRRLYQEGKITRSSLEQAIDSYASEPTNRATLLSRLLNEKESIAFSPQSRAPLHELWLSRGVSLLDLTRPLLFKLLSNFLDQGISISEMPHSSKCFWDCLNDIVNETWFPLTPLTDPPCKELLLKKPSDAIEWCLDRIVADTDCYENYIEEILFSHPGWSGMVHVLDENPYLLRFPRLISLEEWVATELVLEYGWLCRKGGNKFSPLDTKALPLSFPFGVTNDLNRIWHEAFEWTYYEDVLSSLERRSEPSGILDVSAQVFFCLDDRCCSIRRHLEEADPSIETFGTPGFFGVDFAFQGIRDPQPSSFCPVSVAPKHLVYETLTVPDAEKFFVFSRGFFKNTVLSEWLTTQLFGPWHSIKLALNVFFPSIKAEREASVPTRLALYRNGDTRDANGFLLGYDTDEMAERVFRVLRSTGCCQTFSELVVLFGHGSTSANNPYFAAYNCGACAGNSGGPNARAFALMANDAKVRGKLAARGIDIPASTFFLGGLYDTARDEVQYFDLEKLPESHLSAFESFRKTIQEALIRNAKERSRRFEMVNPSLTPEEALRALQMRSVSIFEPRPELNHATNASAVVGRRSLTRSLFLDRRSFLNSYDPFRDRSGEILGEILDAVIPVCAGINLEYYFCRVDNAVYGAGTKLPHNVVSLIGVSNGTEGDLLTGLPSQMVEIHDPLRLLLVIDQKPEIISKTLSAKPALFSWVEKEWIWLASCDPQTRAVQIWKRGKWLAWRLSRGPLPRAADSLSIAWDQKNNISVHEISLSRGGEI